MKKELTEIIFILDKSGSMQSIKDDAIGGFNSFLSEQKKVDGKTNMSLILFNNEVVTVVNGVDINEVEDLTDETYVPSGMTSLLDAVGMGIEGITHRYYKYNEQPDKVIFAIMTDGQENSSKEYTQFQVKEKIEQLSKENDWQFIFLGANIDAIDTASKIGIRADFAGGFMAKGNGGSTAMLHASEMVTSYRNVGAMSTYNSVSSKNDDNSNKNTNITVNINNMSEKTAESGEKMAEIIKNSIKKISEKEGK